MMTPSSIHCLPLLASVAAVASLIGCGGSPPHRPVEATEAASPQALGLTTVTTSELPATFEAGGVVRARTTATVAARVMAPVVSVTARPGDRISRGATLITLDARELVAQAARGKASLLAADESARAAEFQVEAVEAGARLARLTYDRIRGLHEKRSATAQELDQALAALRSAEAQATGARAQVAAAAATRDAARAGAQAADVGVTYTTLTAPFDGIVVSRLVDPGSLATPGTPLLVLEQLGASRLEVALDEARASRVTGGQAADVRFGGEDQAWTRATVAEVSRIDPSTHSFLVKLDLPTGAGPPSGSFGRARFAGPPRRALAVPASTVVRRGQLAFVFVVGADRLARLRPITPGPSAAGQIEVLAGVTAGESLVEAPPDWLTDGTPVTATTAPVGAAADQPTGDRR